MFMCDLSVCIVLGAPLRSESIEKSQSFGTTLSTLILVFAISHTSLLPPLSVSIFATVAARASQLVHKRRQCAYKAVHALMCLLLLHAQSQLKNHNHSGRRCRPWSFSSPFPTHHFFNDRGFSRSRAPVRASTSSICIQSCAYFNAFAASWRCESFKKIIIRDDFVDPNSWVQ